jgi:hypothetical protein
MSIRPYILALERAKPPRLFPYACPPLPAKRRLYLTEEAVKDVQNRDRPIQILDLRGMVEAGLRRWILGQRVYVDLNGKPRFLKPLCPPPSEIWEMRFTDPRVQVRLFCRFAEANTLIGTKFHTRQLLNNKGQWREAMDACEQAWKDLFPSHDPFSGTSIHEYVTENCDDFPLCA